MRIIRLFITLVLGLSLTFAVLWVMEVQSSTAQAAPVVGRAEIPSATTAELHVCLSGCDYSSVQAAVDAANEVDVIKVATGIYPHRRIVLGAVRVGVDLKVTAERRPVGGEALALDTEVP